MIAMRPPVARTSLMRLPPSLDVLPELGERRREPPKCSYSSMDVEQRKDRMMGTNAMQTAQVINANGAAKTQVL